MDLCEETSYIPPRDNVARTRAQSPLVACVSVRVCAACVCALLGIIENTNESTLKVALRGNRVCTPAYAYGITAGHVVVSRT